MKNLHLLPTDKPSRLFIDIDDKKLKICVPLGGEHMMNQNIYITSDGEIKEGDWLIANQGVNKVIQLKEGDYPYGSINNKGDKIFHSKHWKSKIILTTDQDLIKDGVQPIDDEFLEWFVKNPSCESVEVTCDKDIYPYGVETAKGYGWYKIIIPQEEPKQYPIGGYAPGFYSCTCVTCEQSFMGDKRAVQCEPCAIETTQESKQEALSNMDKEFVPYAEALELKELGFDEPCFKVVEGGPIDIFPYKKLDVPLYQQAFRFFRENHDLQASNIMFSNGNYDTGITRYKGTQSVWGNGPIYNTYEEAELACLKKLIEIAKETK
jgi:hypothetical protein